MQPRVWLTPLHCIYSNILSFYPTGTPTPWLIPIFCLCFTNSHSWDGPKTSPFCLLCAIMNLGQSSNSQYPLSLEPRYFLPFFHLSLGCILWERRISVFIPPFHFFRDTFEAISWACARGTGKAKEMVIVPFASSLPFNFFYFYFYVLCHVHRHWAMDAGEL
jgi:hypothetical protein